MSGTRLLVGYLKVLVYVIFYSIKRNYRTISHDNRADFQPLQKLGLYVFNNLV